MLPVDPLKDELAKSAKQIQEFTTMQHAIYVDKYAATHARTRARDPERIADD
jgi:hypothetical protein